MQSGRWPGNEAIGIIYSENREAAASFASMLGMPMPGNIMEMCAIPSSGQD